MGYIAHDAVIVVTQDFRDGGLPDIEAFRQSLSVELRPLVIGPIESAINNSWIYAFLPDGSKEGWTLSDDADEARGRFKDLFRFTYEDNSSPDDWVHVRFGGDELHEVGNHIVESHPSGELRA
jgi:hypothetical protein